MDDIYLHIFANLTFVLIFTKLVVCCLHWPVMLSHAALWLVA